MNISLKYKTVLGAMMCAMLATAAPAGTDGQERDSYDIPAYLSDGARTKSISLNGTWDFRYSPRDKWQSIHVPGEAAMQGFAIKHDSPFLYRKNIRVPASFIGKRVILRFDGVYSHARLSVNGCFVREHHGGFTRWETDITDYVTKGDNELLLEVTDRLDEISYASGYAHHPIGGILRDVTLFALPGNHLKSTYVETELDSLYRDAVLAVHSTAVIDKPGMAVELELTAPDGRKRTVAAEPFHPGRRQWPGGVAPAGKEPAQVGRRTSAPLHPQGNCDGR